MENKEIVNVNQTTDLALTEKERNDELREMLESLDVVTLPKIKILKESAKYAFSEEDERAEFTGTILKFYYSSAKWAMEMTDQKSNDDKKPECVSFDSRTGSRYGSCAKCRFQAFNAAKDDELRDSKTNCKAGIDVFVLVPGKKIPYYLHFPATTRKTFRPFVTDMVNDGKPWSEISVTFGLTKDDKNGMKFSIGKFKFAGKLTPEETKNVKVTKAVFESAITRTAESAIVENIKSEEEPF